MTVNALGSSFGPGNISRVLLGRYTESVAELQAGFLDLELMAADLYRAEIASGSEKLSALMTATGQSFSGIDTNSTWLLALICGKLR